MPSFAKRYKREVTDKIGVKSGKANNGFAEYSLNRLLQSCIEQDGSIDYLFYDKRNDTQDNIKLGILVNALEKSFQMGAGEVVKWLTADGLCEHKIARRGCAICWNKKLKEWGLSV